MPLVQELQNLLESGVHQIGQLEIQTNVSGCAFLLCHIDDASSSKESSFGGLEPFAGPSAARQLSTHAADGTYRFTKAQTNLKRGWVMILANAEELRQALDQFYPAALGLFIARRNGKLEVENLRDKLNRQTGMYRFARTISDVGAQRLVREVCGPAHQCAKRILWQIDADTPLEDSEASRYRGNPGNLPAPEVVPLLCREACNHFVAECRKAAKAESEQKNA